MNLDEQITTDHLLMMERACRICGHEKSLLADFHRCGKDSTLPSSYSYECKECSRIRAVKNYRKKKKYQMLRKKDLVCSICNTTEPGGKYNRFIMDEKNLLCRSCDLAIKEVDANIHTLERMIDYLHERNRKL